MNKVVRDGKVAVLISSDYGAGWYTWNTEIDNAEVLLFDPILVAAVEANDFGTLITRAKELCPSCYTGGASDGLHIEWVPEGEEFEVQEYDGAESLHIIGNRSYLRA